MKRLLAVFILLPLFATAQAPDSSAPNPNQSTTNPPAANAGDASADKTTPPQAGDQSQTPAQNAADTTGQNADGTTQTPASTQSTGATVFVNGDATINGNPINTRSVPLMVGDKIQTHDGSAFVQFNGSSVNLPKSTSATFEPNLVNLGCGSAGVQTRTGLETKVADVDVRPDSQNSSYTVVTHDGDVTVSALKSNLTLTRQGQQMDLKRGDAVKISTTCNLDPAANGPAQTAQNGQPFGKVVHVQSLGTKTNPVALEVLGASALAVIVSSIIANHATIH